MGKNIKKRFKKNAGKTSGHLKGGESESPAWMLCHEQCGFPDEVQWRRLIISFMEDITLMSCSSCDISTELGTVYTDKWSF